MSAGNHSLFHRLAHTPLRDVLRFRITSRLDWRGMIARSGLPAEIQALIIKVVHRTRLWRLERADVARELIAHFQDGLAAGRRADELIKAFGDPRPAAKLIRRAKKRSRPLAWHFARRCTQAFGVFVLIYFVAWAALMTKKPVVSVDYAERMLEGANNAKPEEKAWPIYRKAWLDYDSWHNHSSKILEVPTAGGYRRIRPGDAGWQAAKAFLDKHRVVVEAVHLGADRRYTGMPAGFFYDLSEEDALAYAGPDGAKGIVGRKRPDEASRVNSEYVIGFMLPPLGMMRQMGTLVALDALAASERNDSPRIAQDIHAILGIARQTRGSGTLIEQMVTASLIHMANETLSDVLNERPASIADSDLVALAHDLAAARSTCACDLTVEKWMMLDTIQRCYSDGGAGGGVLTVDGLRFIDSLGVGTSDGTNPFLPVPRTMATFGLPLLTITTAGRKELTERVEALAAIADEDTRRPLWVLLHGGSAADKALKALYSSSSESRRYPLIRLLMPATGAAAKTMKIAEARLDATAVATALEAYHRRERRYPDSLARLAPRYLPAPPLDHSTGEPLLMKIVDGKPLLYGRGLNKTDDGGLRTATPGKREGEIPEQGDWVLYPPKFEPEAAPATQPGS